MYESQHYIKISLLSLSLLFEGLWTGWRCNGGYFSGQHRLKVLKIGTHTFGLFSPPPPTPFNLINVSEQKGWWLLECLNKLYWLYVSYYLVRKAFTQQWFILNKHLYLVLIRHEFIDLSPTFEEKMHYQNRKKFFKNLRLLHNSDKLR